MLETVRNDTSQLLLAMVAVIWLYVTSSPVAVTFISLCCLSGEGFQTVLDTVESSLGAIEPAEWERMQREEEERIRKEEEREAGTMSDTCILHIVR